MTELSQRLKRERQLPIIALVNKETLNSFDVNLNIDDFVIKPCDVTELELRVKRLLHRTSNTDSGELIKCGDLAIDMAKCEVSVEGRLIVLTFREYELLKFLGWAIEVVSLLVRLYSTRYGAMTTTVAIGLWMSTSGDSGARLMTLDIPSLRR